VLLFGTIEICRREVTQVGHKNGRMIKRLVSIQTFSSTETAITGCNRYLWGFFPAEQLLSTAPAANAISFQSIIVMPKNEWQLPEKNYQQRYR
jgi:hypothetical protein